jgi:2-aminoadipate transaminase
MTVGKQASDVHTPLFCQLLVDEWMETYDFEAHIRKIQDIYRTKLNLMCDLIDSELGDFVTYNRPEGGLFVWCLLREGVDMLSFCKATWNTRSPLCRARRFWLTKAKRRRRCA